MAIQNFNQVVDALNQFSNAHLSLKRFKTSFFEQIDNFATAENSFPILYVVPGDVNFEEQIDVMSFRVYCVDILQKDRSNEQSILNETLLVLRDLVNWIRETSTLDLNVVGTPRAVPINNFLTEFTVGFYIDLAVETSPETNDCSIPFSSNFQYSGITCDYTYVSQFLTCDTVASCQSIIDIQNQINSLTGATDTFVTGFTYNDANRLTISQNGGQSPLNVFINTFSGLTTDYVDINTTATITSTPGRLLWNDVDGTVQLGLKGGVVKTEIGQGLVTRVVNKTVPNIDLLASDYQVVVVAGAQGQRLSIKLALANNDANSAGTLGFVAENINKNQEGFIVTVGLLKNINTTGNLQGETWNDGDILYLSPISAGTITNIKPQAPQHTVIVGYVEYSHPNNGKIYVKIDNGYELDELHNVRISGETNNQVLSYDSGQSVWVNRTLPNPIYSSASSGTVVTNTNTNTFSKALLVSANSYTTDDIPEVLIRCRRVSGTTANNVYVARLYWNVTPDIDGTPTLLATAPSVVGGSNTLHMSRNLAIVNATNNTSVTIVTTAFATDFGTNATGVITTNPSNVAIDWTQTGYIVVAIQNTGTTGLNDRNYCDLIRIR